MRYLSTRGDSGGTSLSDAITRGLAPDGGLYVPTSFPTADFGALAGARSLPEIGVRLLTPFFAGDRLEGELEAICQEAFDFSAPLRDLPRRTAVLELFHGPTAAFKDFGARFLAATLARIRAPDEPTLTVLVATSGDTGGAVAAAFAGRPGFEVAVLYPKGMVSARQEKQLTCWGGNVRAFRVRGDFDACQRMVKQAFVDESLQARRPLTSANSISLGRLLPQMVYYAAASLEYLHRHGTEPGFIIPSGNVGNATACFWTRRMGLPIREIILATNANRTLSRFVDEGVWEPAPTVATLATAMDVGDPSNMERLFALYGGHEEARESLRASLVTDDEIREEIRAAPDRWGQIWDPHTATGFAVRDRISSPDWIVVATAHPAKFDTVVEPLVRQSVDVPPALAALLDRPSLATEIDATLEALRAELT